MQDRQNEYERRATALNTWIDQQSQWLQGRDFGTSLGEAQAAQAALRDFVVAKKPAQEGEKLDLETLFAEIQTQLKVNNRKPYLPPTGLTPEDTDGHFEALHVAQKNHATAVRQNRFRFVTKVETKLSEEKLKEIEASFKHFDSNKSNTLDKTEFKAALSAMSVFFSSEGDFEKTLNLVSQGTGSVSLEAYTSFLTARYQDRDTPDQLKESFKAVAEGGSTISSQQLLTPPLSKEDAAYLESAMPRSGAGFDYAAFVDSNYE